MPIVKDFFEGIKIMGRQEGVRVASRYMLLPLIDLHYAVVLRRSLQIPFAPPKFPAGVTARLATVDDLQLFKNMIPPIRLKRFERKLNAGEICLVALYENRGVALGWASPADSLTVNHTPLKLGPKDLYLWGAYVTPAFRRRGLMTAMANMQLRIYQEQGWEYTYQITDWYNRPALNLAKRMSCVPVANILTLRLVEWRIARHVSVETLHRDIAVVTEVNTPVSSEAS